MRKEPPIGRLRAKPAACRRAFDLMFRAFGPQHWWPGDTADEMIIGAMLTQNTAWTNVKKAIANLREAGVLSLRRVADLDAGALTDLIRPAGYYNVKAKRLQSACRYFVDRSKVFTESNVSGQSIASIASTGPAGELDSFRTVPTETLRAELLSVHGIGRETADSILLYALGRPVFVIDAYTLRIGARHGWFPEGTQYEEARSFFERSLGRSIPLYNEYHAFLVATGKDYCKPKARCEGCPLNTREFRLKE